jgi:hypothetical protein
VIEFLPFLKEKAPNAGAYMDPMKIECRKKYFFPEYQVGSILFNAPFWRLSDTV